MGADTFLPPAESPKGRDIEGFLKAAESALTECKAVADTWKIRKAAEVYREAARVLESREIERKSAELIARAEFQILKLSPPVPPAESGAAGGRGKAVLPKDGLRPQVIRNIRHALPEKEADFETALAEAAQKKITPSRAFFKRVKKKLRIQAARERKAEKEARPKLKSVSFTISL